MVKEYDNQPTSIDYALAEKFTNDLIGPVIEPPVSITVGDVNKVFHVKTDESEVVVRLTQASDKINEYEKERWCIDRAREYGVVTPPVLATGFEDSTAFMIQSYVNGRPGIDPSIDRKFIWSAIGAALKKIHSIKTEGFGLDLSDLEDGKFNDSWTRYLGYNVDALTEDDVLVQRGYLSTDESCVLRKWFTEIRNEDLKLGLCHGDVSPRNTVVDGDGKVHIIDWGGARSDVVPYSDFANILRWEALSEKSFRSFCESYGLTKGINPIMQNRTAAIALLTATDKLRWAIDHSHESLNRFIAGLRWTLDICQDKIDWFSSPYTESYGLEQITIR